MQSGVRHRPTPAGGDAEVTGSYPPFIVKASRPLRMALTFRCRHAFHVVLQLIEPLIPNRALRNHPVFGSCERLRCKVKSANPPLLVRSHQTTLLEHGKMLSKGRQGHTEWTR